MKTASIPQLVKAIARLETSIKLNGFCYASCYKEGDWINAGIYHKSIIRSFNEMADLSTRIVTLELSGDTDAITTAQALSLLGIDYTLLNSSFCINS